MQPPFWKSKIASTAFSRRVSAGQLSPQNIARAARGMPVGAVRQVKVPGLPTGATGQYNLADTVVGNWGDKGYAGLAVRKLPTRKVPGGPEEYYAGMKAMVSSMNRKFHQRSIGQDKETRQLLAPIVSTGSTGLFQLPATGTAPKRHAEVDPMTRGVISDLHMRNRGPNGQILDFAVPKNNAPPAAKVTTDLDFISPAKYVEDELGFVDKVVDLNQIRKYWLGSKTSAAPTVAGLCILAEDTGRVLMLQRGITEGDPASGKPPFWQSKIAVARWRTNGPLAALANGGSRRIYALLAAKKKLGLPQELPGLSKRIQSLPVDRSMTDLAGAPLPNSNTVLTQQPTKAYRGHTSPSSHGTEYSAFGKATPYGSPSASYADTYGNQNALWLPAGKVHGLAEYDLPANAQFGPDGALQGYGGGTRTWKLHAQENAGKVPAFNVSDVSVGDLKPVKQYLSVDHQHRLLPSESADQITNEVFRKLSAAPTVAGLCILAEDTGRVLMLQRGITEGDPASGKWECPGGHVEPGESPLIAAKREWREETGMGFPRGKLVASWQHGIYRGHVWKIQSESQLKINLPKGKRRVINPDDPDGDAIETVAWWRPEMLKSNPAVRQELKDSMRKFQFAIRLGSSKFAEAPAPFWTLKLADGEPAPLETPASPAGLDYGRIAQSAGTGGLFGIATNSVPLALAGLMFRRRMPVLGSMLTTAAKDGLTVYNPVKTVPLLRRMPKTVSLASQQINAMNHAMDVSPKGMTPDLMRNPAVHQASHHAMELARQSKAYQSQYGKKPLDDMEKLVGGISGLVSGGAGAMIGGGNELYSQLTAEKTSSVPSWLS